MARKCQSCETREGMARFENETFTIDYAGMTAMVEGLSGWRCGGCGEVEFDAESAHRYATAGDDLVLRDRTRQGKEIRRIREKLGLSQAAAARLTGGGHNAFSRYERGEVAPLPAVINLFKLLDRHPDLLKDLADARGETRAAAAEVRSDAVKSTGRPRPPRRASRKPAKPPFG